MIYNYVTDEMSGDCKMHATHCDGTPDCTRPSLHPMSWLQENHACGRAHRGKGLASSTLQKHEATTFIRAAVTSCPTATAATCINNV